jgi:xylulokinase
LGGDWVAATSAVMDQLAAAHDLSRVQGIGLSGQMHGAVCIDKAGDVLRPAILWNDTRAHAEAAALDTDPRFRATTGNIVFPGFKAPKIVWMRAHEPALADRIAMILLPKDYLRLWLSGEAVSEMSDAAGTAWLDILVARPGAGDFGAAFGAARLAMLAVIGDRTAITQPAIDRVFTPDRRLADAFATAHARHKTAIQAILELS